MEVQTHIWILRGLLTVIALYLIIHAALWLLIAWFPGTAVSMLGNSVVLGFQRSLDLSTAIPGNGISLNAAGRSASVSSSPAAFGLLDMIAAAFCIYGIGMTITERR